MPDSLPPGETHPTVPVETGKGPAPSTAAFLARASALLAIATLLSRLMGLLREMLTARYYGASGQTDSFFYALIIPELLRTLIISGAVSSVFIPLMTEVQRKGRIEETRRMAGMMLSFVSLIAIVVVVIGEFAAPLLVQASHALSFADEPLDPEKLRLTSELIRIFLPTVLLVSLWGLMGGILNALDNFHVPGIAPIAWNGTIIVILIVVGKYGDVHHVAWAFVIGHAVQVLFHLPALRKARIYPTLIDWRHPMILQFLALAPAALLAYATQSVNAFIGQGLALTKLSESAASALAYAFRIQQLPMAIFGVSVATAMFPTLSRHATAGGGKDLIRTLGIGLRTTTLATLPAVVFFLVLPLETIRLLLERGVFTSQNTQDVAMALYCYSWATLPMALSLLTARTFFSEKDMRTPAVLGLLSILLFYIFSLNFAGAIGFAGIALSTSAVAWMLLIASVIIIHNRHRKDTSLLAAIGIKSPVQMIVAGVAEAGVLWLFKVLCAQAHGAWALLGLILLAALVGATVYLGVLRLFGNPDLTETLQRLMRRR